MSTRAEKRRAEKTQYKERILTTVQTALLEYKKWSERTPEEKQALKQLEAGSPQYVWFTNRMVKNPDEEKAILTPYVIEELQGKYVKGA